MLQNGNITVFETLYALSGNWPSAATQVTVQRIPDRRLWKPRAAALILAKPQLTTLANSLSDEVVYDNQATNLPQDGGYYSNSGALVQLGPAYLGEIFRANG